MPVFTLYFTELHVVVIQIFSNLRLAVSVCRLYFTFLDDDFLIEEDPIGGFINPRILAVTDLLAVIRFQPSSGMSSVTVVSTRDGVEVFDYSCLADGFPAALISKDVLLLVKWAAGDDEVLASWLGTSTPRPRSSRRN